MDSTLIFVSIALMAVSSFSLGWHIGRWPANKPEKDSYCDCDGYWSSEEVYERYRRKVWLAAFESADTADPYVRLNIADTAVASVDRTFHARVKEVR